MAYKTFRAAGHFVGSGAVEAGCKAVVGQRLKLSGMRWSVRGATGIATLRYQQTSGRPRRSGCGPTLRLACRDPATYESVAHPSLTPV